MKLLININFSLDYAVYTLIVYILIGVNLLVSKGGYLMSTNWIIVADGSRCRIFSGTSASAVLNEITTLVHPGTRLHEQELTSDLPGRAFDHSGEGRHAMETTVEPKKHEIESFARQINDYLEKERTNNKFKHLVIIAAPAMLGQLRGTFNPEIMKCVGAEINKDLTQHTVEDIQKHLPAH